HPVVSEEKRIEHNRKLKPSAKACYASAVKLLRQSLTMEDADTRRIVRALLFDFDLDPDSGTTAVSNCLPSLSQKAATVDDSCGLLIGYACIKPSPNSKDDDPRPVHSEYKSFWITSINGRMDYRKKDSVIIAPGADGWYVYKNVTVKRTGHDSAYYNVELNKTVTYRSDQKCILPRIDPTDQYYFSESDNLVYTGRKYGIIYISRCYTSGAGGYQFQPSFKIYEHGQIKKSWVEKGYNEKRDTGIVLLSMLTSAEKAHVNQQIEFYKSRYDRGVAVESSGDRECISESDYTLERRDGQWVPVVPVIFSNWKYSHNYIVAMKEIDCELPPELVNDNGLCMKWFEIKRLLPDAIDAVSSPDGKLLAIQCRKALKIFRTDRIRMQPELEIPLDSTFNLIENQWALGGEMTRWNNELTAMMQ
ncbi:MAG TPA: hypothetical protein VHV83_21700, partial [Armatimonadota bacterium]|nr:hypothetical protein [Armatimonadota bacterium]